MAEFIDQSGTTRFEGTLVGPGITMPTCVLQATATDIHLVASHPLLWDALLDNPYNFNPITAIPDGLGLTFLFNGTSAVIATTEAGTWSFSLAVAFAQDAAWTGLLGLDQSAAMELSGIGNVPNPRLAISEVVTYPAAAGFTPQVVTDTQSTANPLNASAILTIVRLG